MAMPVRVRLMRKSSASSSAAVTTGTMSERRCR